MRAASFPRACWNSSDRSDSGDAASSRSKRVLCWHLFLPKSFEETMKRAPPHMAFFRGTVRVCATFFSRWCCTRTFTASKNKTRLLAECCGLYSGAYFSEGKDENRGITTERVVADKMGARGWASFVRRNDPKLQMARTCVKSALCNFHYLKLLIGFDNPRFNQSLAHFFLAGGLA